MVTNLFWKALALTFCFLATVMPVQSDEKYVPLGWQKQALDLLAEEKKIKESMWIGNETLWISLKDDGSPRNGYAGYVCLVIIGIADMPSGAFTYIEALDIASIALGQRKVLGSFGCVKP